MCQADRGTKMADDYKMMLFITPKEKKGEKKPLIRIGMVYRINYTTFLLLLLFFHIKSTFNLAEYHIFFFWPPITSQYYS
mgnify:CR=1 FL=1